MKQLSILFLSVILFSCSDGDKRYHIDETTSPSDTLTYLKSDMSLLNGVVYSEFGENGRYINGKKDGIHKEWYESGQIKSELEFEKGKSVFKKYTKYWYDDGQLMLDGKYDGDQQYSKMFYWTGKLKYELIYEGEKIISKKCWDYDGNQIECKDDEIIKWN